MGDAADAPPAVASVPRRRVTGIDVARALALLGMSTAHLGTGHRPGGWGSSWMWIADGRSSACSPPCPASVSP